MRWITLLALLVVSTISSFATGLAADPGLTRLPVPPADEIIGQHPIIGSDVVIIAVGSIPAVFAADGTVAMAFPEVIPGHAGTTYISGGTGTWEAIGADGVLYTVERMIKHVNGDPLGTTVIQGYLARDDAGGAFSDAGLLTVITTRDAQDNVLMVFSVGADGLMTVGTGDAFGQDARVRTFGGCNTCR